ncbi:MAG: carboxypeptidase regulatory-like domain-containing protein [Planctomycetota bacterium]
MTGPVWNPESWKRLYNNPKSFFISDHPNFRKPVAPPRVDVYIGGGGAIVWEDVKVPENVKVIDKRPGSVSPRFAGSGLVRGKVFNMTTGEPIPGAEIVLTKHEEHGKWKEIMHGKTNKRGICRIAKIPPGYYEVRVRAKGYASRKQGSYNNKQPEYHKFKVGLAKPSYIKGIVNDVDGKPIEGVKVSATNVIGTDGFSYPCVGDKSALTNKQGRFEIRSLPIGVMNISCRAESLHLKNSIFEQYPIPSDEIKLTMTGTGIIRGKVVSKDGEAPSGDVHIHVRPPGEQIGKWGGSRRCEGDGSFEFTGVPPGEYLVGTDTKLLTEGDRTNARLISVKAGKTYEVKVVHIDQRTRR